MKLYRLLLLAFPPHVREEFGREMELMFEEQLRMAGQNGGSALRLWAMAASDAIRHGLAERFSGNRPAYTPGVGSPQRRRLSMQALLQDLRYAGRLFAAQPAITCIGILTLALGIGGNAAVFSAVDAILLRPLPYPEPDRVVMVWEKREAEGVLKNVVAPADFLDWRKLNTTFTSMGALVTTTADLTGQGEPVRLNAAGVSPGFFDVLGVRPALGRSFRPDEEIVGNHRVIVVTHGLWQSRFGSDPTLVGRRILLNGIPHEVVGVLPDSFEFPDASVEMWAPLAIHGTQLPPSRALHNFHVYARLKPGMTLEQARADMARVGSLLSEQYPDTNRAHSAWVTLLSDEVQEPVRSGLFLLLGAVGFVLLIACVNVANLFLARAATRRREIAIRAALGASRSRLARQSLTESLLLALLGGMAGVLIAYWSIQLLRELAPSGVPMIGLRQLGLTPRVLGFTFLISIAAGGLFGSVPAWQLATLKVNESLNVGSRTAGSATRRIRLTLVIGEIALASLLLVGAGLTLRSVQRLLDVDAGYRSDGVLTTLITLPNSRYNTAEKRLAAREDLEHRFASIPGVKSVGTTSHLPLSGQDARLGIEIEGREPTADTPTRAHPRSVSHDYFRTMGIGLVTGRWFAASDGEDAPEVVIVNETFVRQYLPAQSPLGTRVRLGGTTDWREIVGIVRDVRHWGLDRPVNPELYMPHRQFTWSAPNYVMAVDGDPARVASAVREHLRAVDPELPLASLRTMKEVAAQSVAARRASMLLLAIFGGLALVLAAAGIYGVMTHLVAVRRSEIGVRMTLGARPIDVMTLILREGVLQAAVGLAVGVSAGVLLMKAFRSMLYEVSPADPLTLGAVGTVLFVTALVACLLATALFACLLPARRAMKVDPVTTLRQ